MVTVPITTFHAATFDMQLFKARIKQDVKLTGYFEISSPLCLSRVFTGSQRCLAAFFTLGIFEKISTDVKINSAVDSICGNLFQVFIS